MSKPESPLALLVAGLEYGASIGQLSSEDVDALVAETDEIAETMKLLLVNDKKEV